MGDRSAICIKQNNDTVIEIYSHWEGPDIIRALPDALKVAQERCEDLSYFNRIVIQNILDSIANKESETGAGIRICNFENYNDMHLDNNAVFIFPKTRKIICHTYTFTFDEIINDEISIRKLWKIIQGE